jgi:hypothetical protein
MKIKHEGSHLYRLHPDAGNPLEVIYAEAWEKQNERRSGMPHGTLEYLAGNGQDPVAVTQEQATIAATVIQWLGSPVGQRFVEECLKKGGFEVRRKK